MNADPRFGRAAACSVRTPQPIVRPSVAPPPPPPIPVEVAPEPDEVADPAATADQAIFTSVRSAMACGYRITSASPGLTGAEKAEITRWSPSHGSLCAAEGLASYALSSGRRVIAHSCHAGPEPSGRGGERVYTRIIVLSVDEFERFAFNPVAVYRACQDALDGPLLSLPAVLPKVSVPDASPQPSDLSNPELQAASAAALALLARRRTIAVRPELSLPLLEWTLMLLPPAFRAELATSAGLAFSPSRPVDLAWVTAEAVQDRDVQGKDIEILDADAGEWPHSSKRWAGLIQHWAEAGLHAELLALCDVLGPEVQPADLESVAEICEDLESAASADMAEVDAIIRKYSQHNALSATEAFLIEQLLAVVRERRNAIATA